MLYLSGARAEEVARLGARGLRRRVVGDEPGQASGVKMCTASIYKGTTALWAQALQTADALGVLGPVLDDLEEEFPAQVASAGRRIAVATAKSARFVAEMDNIALTQGEAGASAELFEGMAAVYRRLVGHSPRRPDARGGRSPDRPARRPHPTPRTAGPELDQLADQLSHELDSHPPQLITLQSICTCGRQGSTRRRLIRRQIDATDQSADQSA